MQWRKRNLTIAGGTQIWKIYTLVRTYNFKTFNVKTSCKITGHLKINNYNLPNTLIIKTDKIYDNTVIRVGKICIYLQVQRKIYFWDLNQHSRGSSYCKFGELHYTVLEANEREFLWEDRVIIYKKRTFETEKEDIVGKRRTIHVWGFENHLIQFNI